MTRGERLETAMWNDLAGLLEAITCTQEREAREALRAQETKP